VVRRLAVLLLPVVLLAACSAGSPEAAEPAATAKVAASADCLAPQVLDELGLAGTGAGSGAVPPSSTAHGPAPERGRVPADFAATGVLVCVPGGTLVDGQGAWSSVVATRRGGDTDALIKALALADQRSPDAAACGKAQPMDLWLTDALDRGVRVAFPINTCGGGPREEVTKALDAMVVTDVATYQVELVEPSPTPSS